MAKPELTADQCRAEAASCRRLARLTMKTLHRVMLEHIAATWEQVAQEIEQGRSDRSVP
jgi:hypothetical protein